jgi:L-asparaginase II
MTTAPDMVSGPGTFTTRLMEVTGGRVLGKEGAEGIYATAVRGPVALGMVLKIADGNSRAWPGAVLDLLRQLGSLSEEELRAMEVFHRGVIRNRRGIEVGRVVPDVELEEVNGPDPGTPA